MPGNDIFNIAIFEYNDMFYIAIGFIQIGLVNDIFNHAICFI
jgi:hypothetical protein